MKELFRKEAVDSLKKQFVTDKRLSRLSFSTLVMTAVLIIGLKLFSVWFFDGTVVNSINVDGVLYPSASMENVYAVNQGIISSVNVKPGDKVTVGELLAVIPSEDMLAILDDGNSTEKKYDELEKKRSEYVRKSFVRSMVDGTVVSVAQRGRSVMVGDSVALIAANDMEFNRNMVIVFLPTEKKGNIHEGDIVQISPDYAKREKYGYITGHIYKIGKDIISKNDAIENYNFYNIPNMLDESKTYVTVNIVLDENDDYESGLAWSQASSGKITPKLGTHCNCSIITGEQTPFDWLFGGGNR